jgi:hypothetical protein
MAPTKEDAKGSAAAPIDLTADAVASDRVTKPKAKPTPKKPAAKKPVAGKDDPNPAKKGKESGPACTNCKKAKARCDRVLACERCLKAGVACPSPDEAEAVASAMAAGKPAKACERCKKMKAACVRSGKCVKCEKKGVDCVVA